MTRKDRENRFIARCRADGIPLTLETELLLRYGFSQGAAELARDAFAGGMDEQRDRVLAALGAQSVVTKGPLP